MNLCLYSLIVQKKKQLAFFLLTLGKMKYYGAMQEDEEVGASREFVEPSMGTRKSMTIILGG
jgi:hypothetical protein